MTVTGFDVVLLAAFSFLLGTSVARGWKATGRVLAYYVAGAIFTAIYYFGEQVFG